MSHKTHNIRFRNSLEKCIRSFIVAKSRRENTGYIWKKIVGFMRVIGEQGGSRRSDFIFVQTEYICISLYLYYFSILPEHWFLRKKRFAEISGSESHKGFDKLSLEQNKKRRKWKTPSLVDWLSLNMLKKSFRRLLRYDQQFTIHNFRSVIIFFFIIHDCTSYFVANIICP